MSRWFRGKGQQDDADQPRQKHKAYRFLVTHGWTHEWVHCPICMSVNDGHAGWKPTYTGGFVNAEIPIYNGSADTHIVALACVCEAAEIFIEHQRMKPWDGATTSILLQAPAIVLWDKKLDPERPADLPPEPAPENLVKVSDAMSKQLKRHIRGELTVQQLIENQQALMMKYLGPPIVVAPGQGRAAPAVGDVSDTGMKLPF